MKKELNGKEIESCAYRVKWPGTRNPRVAAGTPASGWPVGIHLEKREVGDDMTKEFGLFLGQVKYQGQAGWVVAYLDPFNPEEQLIGGISYSDLSELEAEWEID